MYTNEQEKRDQAAIDKNAKHLISSLEYHGVPLDDKAKGEIRQFISISFNEGATKFIHNLSGIQRRNK